MTTGSCERTVATGRRRRRRRPQEMPELRPPLHDDVACCPSHAATAFQQRCQQQFSRSLLFAIAFEVRDFRHLIGKIPLQARLEAQNASKLLRFRLFEARRGWPPSCGMEGEFRRVPSSCPFDRADASGRVPNLAAVRRLVSPESRRRWPLRASGHSQRIDGHGERQLPGHRPRIKHLRPRRRSPSHLCVRRATRRRCSGVSVQPSPELARVRP